MRNFHADLALISCGGFDLDYGFSESTIDSAELKRTMCTNSDKTIVLADESKYGKKILYRSTTLNDIDVYGKEKDTLKFNNVSSRLVWQCVRSFSDADAVLSMSVDEIQYYESLADVCKFNESVSNLIWKISHYNSGQECNLELAIRSIIELMKNPFITKCGIDCIRDLTKKLIFKLVITQEIFFVFQ